MMPIMTGGLSSLPPEFTSNGSAFNTVVQRTSSAIGLAAMTALMTLQQAQGLADRTGLMSSSGAAATASSGAASSSGSSGGAGSALLQQYSMYETLQSQVFITALNDLLVVTAVLTAIGVPLALMLPSGKPAVQEGPRVLEG
jgi:3-oxoacyl-ACP reductase-like protein